VEVEEEDEAHGEGEGNDAGSDCAPRQSEQLGIRSDAATVEVGPSVNPVMVMRLRW
jgi:hypothetical protein